LFLCLQPEEETVEMIESDESDTDDGKVIQVINELYTAARLLL